MFKITISAFVFFISFQVASLEAKEVVAFLGAEGFGAIATGGRGGRIIKVTNLNSSGPGSLQAASTATGPRIVIFDVAGVIRGDVEIKHSNITIAGQTAPSPGITIEGRLLARPENGERLHDIVIRFLRVRPRPATGHGGDAIQLPKSERIILDHLSLSWANDETIDIIFSSEVTVQWSTIEESDPLGHDKGIAHNFGILSAYPGSGNISIHHNLFAHHSRRMPCLSPYVKGKPGDFRNNVIYDFQEGYCHDGHIPKAGINLVANYYKRGPSAYRVFPFNFHEKGQYYLSGNFLEGYGLIDNLENISLLDKFRIKVNHKGHMLDKPVPVGNISTDTAIVAYERVLASSGMLPRDRVSRRTVKDVKRQEGKWGRVAPEKPDDEWYSLGMQYEQKQPDSDGDGMPDVWEKKRGLNHRDASDHNNIMQSGYSALEEYLNDRAIYLINKYTHNNK